MSDGWKKPQRKSTYVSQFAPYGGTKLKGAVMAKPKKKAKKEPRKPRQARLPEMEDPAIGELETAAEEYASIRDKRMELTKQEVALNNQLLTIMKREKKQHYFHAGIKVDVVVEKEKVRVKIKKDE
jgi:hypothetical protein